MAVTAGVPVIGLVERYNRERGIASIKPIYNDVGHGWAEADAADYPTRGRMFWKGASGVEPGDVVSCRIEHNPSGDDHFLASETCTLPLVEDMRTMSPADAAEQLRIRTVKQPASGRHVRDIFLWCTDDAIVGPFRIDPVRPNASMSGDSGTLARVPVRHGEQALLRVQGSKLYCDTSVPPVAFIDCRSDAVMLRTALHDAVAVMNNAGLPAPTILSTKSHIQQAASQLQVGESTDDRRTKLARLERALQICSDSSTVRSRAAELTDELLSHPDIAAELETIRKSTRAEALAEGRRDFESELVSLRNDETQVKSRLSSLEKAVSAKRAELTDLERSVDRQLNDLDSLVLDRVGKAVDNASELLADSVLLRALGHAHEQPYASPTTGVGRVFDSSGSAVELGKTAEIDQFLRAASSAYGLPHSSLRKIHAAVRAGLIPIVTGNGASAALTAYATVTCAGRISSLPVSHDFLSPVDLLGVRASDPTKPRLHADVLLAASREAEADPAMLVLQSVNQAPTEAFLLPWLQQYDRGIAVPPAAQEIVGTLRVVVHDNVLLAATAVAGATTAPLSPDIWGFCIAIDVPAPVRTTPGHVTPTQSGVKHPVARTRPVGDLTDRLGETLGEYWIVDDGLTATAKRFGDAMTEIDRSNSPANAIAASVLLPALATSLPASALAAAADAIAKWCDTDDIDVSALRKLAHRYHRRFA